MKYTSRNLKLHMIERVLTKLRRIWDDEALCVLTVFALALLDGGLVLDVLMTGLAVEPGPGAK